MKPDYKNGIPKGMLFSLIAGTVLAKRLAFAKQTIRKGRDTSCGVPALHCMASIEKEYAQASKTGEQRGTVLSSRKAE